ncbi:hypothetical protein D3C73_656520 [compost metagenome]
MDVGGNDAIFHFECRRTTQVHVFADRGNSVLDRVGDRLAGCRVDGGADSFDGTVSGECNVGDAANDCLEGVVTGNEVGFRVDFDDNGLGAVRCNADQTFGSRAARLLVGLGDALGAQPVDCRFDVAVVLGQRLLAVHHACAGLFAQFLHQCSGDLSHCKPLVGLNCVAPKNSANSRFWERMYPEV